MRSNKELTLLRLIITQLGDVQSKLESIEKKLDTTSKKCECAHTKKEDEVLSIFSEFIDDLDHVTIRIKEI